MAGSIANDRKQIDGSTAVTGTSTRNDKGTVRYGGNIADSRFRAEQLGWAAAYNGGNTTIYDSSSANPSLRTSIKLFSNGNFGKMLAEKWVMRMVTTELAGHTGHTRIRSPGSDYGIPRTSIHRIHTFSTVKTAEAIRAGEFNFVTGRFTDTWPGTNASDHMANIAGTQTATNDDASQPSRSVPGEFVYRTGKPDVTLADYEAKNI